MTGLIQIRSPWPEATQYAMRKRPNCADKIAANKLKVFIGAAGSVLIIDRQKGLRPAKSLFLGLSRRLMGNVSVFDVMAKLRRVSLFSILVNTRKDRRDVREPPPGSLRWPLALNAPSVRSAPIGLAWAVFWEIEYRVPPFDHVEDVVG
jgi:hypothetical protein